MWWDGTPPHVTVRCVIGWRGINSPVLAAALLSSFKNLVRIVRAMYSRDLLVF